MGCKKGGSIINENDVFGDGYDVPVAWAEDFANFGTVPAANRLQLAAGKVDDGLGLVVEDYDAAGIEIALH